MYYRNDEVYKSIRFTERNVLQKNEIYIAINFNCIVKINIDDINYKLTYEEINIPYRLNNLITVYNSVYSLMCLVENDNNRQIIYYDNFQWKTIPKEVFGNERYIQYFIGSSYYQNPEYGMFISKTDYHVYNSKTKALFTGNNNSKYNIAKIIPLNEFSIMGISDLGYVKTIDFMW